MFGLFETKQVSTWQKPRRDLRALEVKAYRIVHAKKYEKIVKTTTAKAEASVEKLKAKMRRSLMKEVQAWENGRHEWNSLLTRTKAIFRQCYEEAYRLGIYAQGHTELRKPNGTHLAPTHTLSKDDRMWLKSALDEELGYWHRFMRDLRYNKAWCDDCDGEGKIKKKKCATCDGTGLVYTKRMKPEKRLGMYTDTLRSVYDAGRVNSSPEFMLIHWVVGEAEHCPDCLWLQSMSPFHKGNLPTTPRSGGTRCLSNCKCKLVFDPIGVDMFNRFVRYSPRREDLTRKLDMSRRLKLGLPLKRKLKVGKRA